MDIADNFEMIVQGGFAAFAVILLGILFWLVRQLITLQKETNKVIAEHNEVSTLIYTGQTKMIDTLDKLHDKIISRPCIAKKE